MPELEKGPIEFDWKIKNPNYKLIDNIFDILDTGALVLKGMYMG